jgi:hypothetical protein
VDGVRCQAVIDAAVASDAELKWVDVVQISPES